MSNLSPLQTAILRTLAYFDIFDFPLTEEEIWRWIYPQQPKSTITAEDVSAALQAGPLDTMIERQGKFIVVKGRSVIVQTRAERKVRNEKKWRRALTVARYVEMVPFIKMVAVVNTLAIDNARPESDIDLLIVIAPGHIWLTRMIVTGIVALLGYRRHGTNITDRVCLSFYMTTSELDLESLKREDDDPHFAFWASEAVPLLDDGTYTKFVQANAWVNKMLPNAWSWDWRQRLIKPNSGLQSIKNFFEIFFQSPIGLSLEVWARNYQMKRMDKNTTSRSSEPTTDVIISEDVLKFHEADRRLVYRQKFYDRLRSLGL